MAIIKINHSVDQNFLESHNAPKSKNENGDIAKTLCKMGL